ncbi:MAG: endoribonuclease YbeY [marine bacterium B5-7]|nr:MAG: endoribonuclease YbeY [marine bacterium B5-7]
MADDTADDAGTVDVCFEPPFDDDSDDLPDADRVGEYVQAVLCHCRLERNEVTVLFTGAERIRQLNRDYRGKDSTTNVLSFVFEDPPGASSRILGDIVVSPEVARTEACAQGISLESHFTHLIIHGALHLAGFDHVNDRQAAEMEALEIRLLKRFGFDNPYLIQPESTFHDNTDSGKAVLKTAGNTAG